MAQGIIGSSKTRPLALVGVGLLLLLAGPLQAGPIFFPGQMEGDKFVPGKEGAAPWYHVRYSTANVSVTDKTGRVQIDEDIEGPELAVQAVCIIPLPEGTDGKEMRVSYGPAGGRPVILGDATFLTGEKAQAVYEALAKGSGSPRILAFSKRPAILVPRVNVQGKSRLSLTLQSNVHTTQGVSWITCPMPVPSCSSSMVERLSINVDLKMTDPLRSVFSPTHVANVQRKGLNEATATVRANHWAGLDDFRLYWVADKDDLGLRVLAFRNSAKEDGFFMLIGNPTGAAANKVVDKDVILVLDTSGSMRGEKIEQARSALDYCLEHLNAGDRFNVITFGTAVRSFRDDLVATTPALQTAARTFVEETVANGQTNISGALEKALAGKAEAGRPRIMIFLTDGAPTVGERIPEKILDQVKKLNTAGTKIFVMGVGHDVNAHLLDRLAEVTDGSSEYVAPREELDAKVAALYDRLSHPVLSGVTVAFGEAGTASVLPPKLPVLFKGSEIMMVGRYKNGGKHTFTISGNLSGKPTEFTCVANLPEGASEASNDFLPPLWAARQVGYLLQEIRLHGANKELIEEVVRLSKQYGIVTEFTEFIASAQGARGAGGAAGPAAPAAMHKEAEMRLQTARGEQAGKWAVNQAANDRALQGAVAPAQANQYRDRRGNLVSLATVTQVGNRTFYLGDKQWTDAEEQGKRKIKVIKLFSPEYFELLRSNPTFAPRQQLSWAVSMNVGDERIVIEKDGKQQDETIKLAPAPVEDEPQGGRGREQFQNQIPGPRRPGLPQQPNLQQLQRPDVEKEAK